MTDQPPKPRRRRFQFSLRTLLIAVTLAAGVLMAWRAYVEPYRRQRETTALIKELGGECTLEPADKWLRWLYGDDFQNLVLVDLADCNDPTEYLEQVAALPQLKTLVVGGPNFMDDDLDRLKEIATLRGLVLDSTSVTDRSIRSLKRALPNVVVYKSQRRTITAIRWLGGDVDVEVDDVHSQIRRPDLKKYFVYVTRVYFHNSKVSDAGLAHLKALTKLKGVALGGTQVSDAGLAHLRHLTNLEYLLLNGTQVSDAGLAHLRHLTNLEYLALNGTQVSDAGLVHLEGLTTLKGLHLKGSRVTDVGVKKLKKALPDCPIDCPWPGTASPFRERRTYGRLSDVRGHDDPASGP